MNGMFPIEDESWKDERRYLVTMDMLNLRSGSYTLGDVITEGCLGGRAEWLIGIGAVEPTDYDLALLYEGPRERWCP